jgi:hypothetical protein
MTSHISQISRWLSSKGDWLGREGGRRYARGLRWYVYPKECAIALFKKTHPDPRRDVISLHQTLHPSNAVLLGEQSAYISCSNLRVLNRKSLLKAERQQQVGLKLAEGSADVYVSRRWRHTGETLFSRRLAPDDDGKSQKPVRYLISRCGEWVSFKALFRQPPSRCQPAPIRQDKSDSRMRLCSSWVDDNKEKARA